MKIIEIIIYLTIGFILGYFFSPIDRVKTETEIEIIRQQSTSEIIYNECLDQIRLAINPWSGSIDEYPQKDFSNLVEQCVDLKTNPSPQG